MNHKEQINQQQESLHPIILWILASILLHFLLTIGLITLKFRKMAMTEHAVKNQNETFLLMDDSQNPVMPKPVPNSKQTVQQQTKPMPKQEEAKKPERHWSDYTLVPGRKGVDEQKIDNPADLKNLPTPQDQKNKPKELTEPKKTTNVTSEKISPKELSSQTMILDKSSTNVSNSQKNRTPIADQNPYEFVPEPTNRTISFKDLNLGFDNNYQTIGNNANLIQAGRTFESPDPVALKHLTYYNQCAEMMKSAIITHHQVRLAPPAGGRRFHFAITVNRNGKLLSFRTLHGSGHQILDKILSESVQSITLFPPVPKFIIEDPFVMTWIFLH